METLDDKVLTKKDKLKKVLSFKNKHFCIAMIIVASFIYTFGFLAFVQPARMFITGFAVFSQLIVFGAKLDNQYLMILNLAFNVPLIAFGLIKMGKQFVVNTILFLICNALLGLFFTRVIDLPAWNPLDGKFADPVNHYLSSSNYKIILSGVLGGVFVGLGVSTSYLAKGSSGGSDFFILFLSREKGKNVGNIARLFAFGSALIGVVILNIALEHKGFKDSFFSVETINTVFYIMITASIINRIYPVYNKMIVIVITKKAPEISKKLREVEFHHTWTISEVTGGYSGIQKKKIESTMYLSECPDFIKLVRQIDPNAWIRRSKIEAVVGVFSQRK